MADALLIADLVNDFVTGKLGTPRAARIIPNIRRLVEGARKAGVPVIYVGDAHLARDPELKIWGSHSMKGTKGAQVIPELTPEKGDIVLEKRTYSAFYETSLDPILRAHDVRDLAITALLTNICGIHTAGDAFFRGYRPIVVEDGMEALDDESHKFGLDYMKRMYQATIVQASGVLKAWK